MITLTILFIILFAIGVIAITVLGLAGTLVAAIFVDVLYVVLPILLVAWLIAAVGNKVNKGRHDED